MNKNKLAQEVTKREGKKKNMTIAQVKEVMKILDDIRKEEETIHRTYPSPIAGTNSSARVDEVSYAPLTPEWQDTKKHGRFKRVKASIYFILIGLIIGFWSAQIYNLFKLIKETN